MKHKAERNVLNSVLVVSDEMLVKKTLEGDLSAFEELVRRYYGPLLRHAQRYLKDEDEAEDAVQESFVATYKNLEKVDLKRSFKPWVYKLTGNNCIDILRKKKRVFPLAEDVVDSQESSLEIISKHSEDEKVREAVLKLPKKYKLPILGFYFRDLSYTQLSKRLEVSEATLKTHLHRGKALLKKIILEREE